MKSFVHLTLFLFSFVAVCAQYSPDTYCEGYLKHTIVQPDDYEGKVVCTVVKKPNLPNVKQAVIYLHGYNDYFFQSQLGDSITAHGYNFYALDLRKYGRSLLPHQDMFYCKNMKREYFQDIDSTIALVQREGNESILLMGHSTGGLITSYYMKYGKKRSEIAGLILNSPFLDWNMSPGMEHFALPIVSFLGSFIKRMKVSGVSENPCGYSQSLLQQYQGEWSYDTSLKIPYGHTVRAGWIHAINRAQKRARRRTRDIECPVLVMSSDHSVEETDAWNEEFRQADVVLSVGDICKYSQRLGKKVTYRQIPNGKHDLILSEKPARDEAYRVMFEWMKK